MAGPEGNWISDAKKNADLVFGGIKYMLTQFNMKHPGLINTATRKELYKRGAAILVRPGNPKNIHSLKDLTKPGLSILDVNGAGQFGFITSLVKLPVSINLYRGTSIAISTITAHPKEATEIIVFLQSEKGHNIFKKWGWE